MKKWVAKKTPEEIAAADEAERQRKEAKEKKEEEAKEKKGKEKGERESKKGKGKGEKREEEAKGAERAWPRDYGKEPRDFGKKGKGKDEEKGKGKGKSKDAWPSAPKGGGGKGKRRDDEYEDARPFQSSGGKKGGKRDDDEGGGKGGFKGGKKGKGRSDDNHDRPEKPNRSEDMRRQATAHTGQHCTVKKHSSMGCAIITFTDIDFRKFLVDSGDEIEVGDHNLKLKAHHDKETEKEIPSDIFVGWGRQAEKSNPLSEQDLANYFDQRYEEFTSPGGMQAQMQRKRAQDAARMQAEWAKTGVGAPPAAGRPLAGMPMGMQGMPGAAGLGGQPQMAAQQAAQAQYAAMMQAQYMRYQQQQQYAAYVQAQHQQQQLQMMQHFQAQKDAETAARAKRQAGYKASFRVPTDDEVKAKFASLGSPGKEAGAEPDGEATAEEGSPAAEGAKTSEI